MPDRTLVQILLPGLPKYRSAFLTRLKESGKFDLRIYPAHPGDPGLFSIGEATAAFADDIVAPSEPARQFIGGRLIWHTHFRLDPDLGPGSVVVCGGNPRFLNIYPMTLSARRRRIPIIWWCHGWTALASPVTTRIRHWLTRQLPNAVMVYTKKEAEAFVDLGFPAARTFYLNNTIDETLIKREIDRLDDAKLAWFRESERLEGRRLLLFCSRLTPKTRLVQAIEAIETLRVARPDVLLVVIGDGVLRAETESMVNARGLGDHVRFLGALFDEEKLAPWFLSADCLLYPGPIGLSLLHAFAYGLPVVTHDNPRNHNPEIAALEPEQNGLLFKENDAADLARVTASLLTDDTLRARLKHRAFETAHQDFTMAAMVRNFEEAVFSVRRLCRPLSLPEVAERAEAVPDRWGRQRDG